MLKRIIVACVFLPVFIVAFFFCPIWVAGVLLTALCALSAYEFVYVTGITKNKAVAGIAIVFAAAVSWWVYIGVPIVYLVAWAFLLMFSLFSIGIFWHEKIHPDEVVGAIFSAGLFPLCISLMIAILQEPSGKVLIAMPFIAAWVSDTCAYFGGTFFGKHKMAPEISPKKTWEGSVIGIIGAGVVQIVYGIVLANAFSYEVSFAVLIPFALLGAIMGQIGDLALSYVKRARGIKDYGCLMPGHGGVLDRFDSVIFILPLFYVLQIMIGIVR